MIMSLYYSHNSLLFSSLNLICFSSNSPFCFFLLFLSRWCALWTPSAYSEAEETSDSFLTVLSPRKLDTHAAGSHPSPEPWRRYPGGVSLVRDVAQPQSFRCLCVLIHVIHFSFDQHLLSTDCVWDPRGNAKVNNKISLWFSATPSLVEEMR